MHWRRKWQPTPVFLLGDSQGRGSLVGRCLRDCTESTRLKQLSSSNRELMMDREACRAPVHDVTKSRTLLRDWTELTHIYGDFHTKELNSNCRDGLSGGSDSTESACNPGDPGLIPGLGRSPGSGGLATHSSMVAWRTPWTEESGRPQSVGLLESNTT